MILYFTGTGNGRFIAERIADAVPQKIISLNNKIKTADYSEIHSDEPLIFVLPTYCWRIPRVAQDWIRKTSFSGCNEAYFIMHCGGNAGNAIKYVKKLCRYKDFEFKGLSEIVMPENYIALFDVPKQTTAIKIINNALPSIDSAIEIIKSKKDLPDRKIKLTQRLLSGIVNIVFYKFIVKDKKFYVKDTCTGCALCEKLCPLNNISIENGRPIWHKNCTHCMACICRCPEGAIEYKGGSEGKPRYKCPS